MTEKEFKQHCKLMDKIYKMLRYAATIGIPRLIREERKNDNIKSNNKQGNINELSSI